MGAFIVSVLIIVAVMVAQFMSLPWWGAAIASAVIAIVGGVVTVLVGRAHHRTTKQGTVPRRSTPLILGNSICAHDGENLSLFFTLTPTRGWVNSLDIGEIAQAVSRNRIKANIMVQHMGNMFNAGGAEAKMLAQYQKNIPSSGMVVLTVILPLQENREARMLRALNMRAGLEKIINVTSTRVANACAIQGWAATHVSRKKHAELVEWEKHFIDAAIKYGSRNNALGEAYSVVSSRWLHVHDTTCQHAVGTSLIAPVSGKTPDVLPQFVEHFIPTMQAEPTVSDVADLSQGLVLGVQADGSPLILPMFGGELWEIHAPKYIEGVLQKRLTYHEPVVGVWMGSKPPTGYPTMTVLTPQVDEGDAPTGVVMVESDGTTRIDMGARTVVGKFILTPLEAPQH